MGVLRKTKELQKLPVCEFVPSRGENVFHPCPQNQVLVDPNGSLKNFWLAPPVTFQEKSSSQGSNHDRELSTSLWSSCQISLWPSTFLTNDTAALRYHTTHCHHVAAFRSRSSRTSKDLNSSRHWPVVVERQAVVCLMTTFLNMLFCYARLHASMFFLSTTWKLQDENWTWNLIYS